MSAIIQIASLHKLLSDELIKAGISKTYAKMLSTRILSSEQFLSNYLLRDLVSELRSKIKEEKGKNEEVTEKQRKYLGWAWERFKLPEELLKEIKTRSQAYIAIGLLDALRSKLESHD